jgi:3-phosphoshikimate 1-carboxyvinyltransferase
MKKISTNEIKNTNVTMPGSKSYTHRLLIASALSDGRCLIKNMLISEDTLLTLGALNQMGVETEKTEEGLRLEGTRGVLAPSESPIYLGNSGTSMRLLTGVAAIGKNIYTLTGTDRMHERPIQDLIDALKMMEVPVTSMNKDGCPPVEIMGSKIKGGQVSIKCNTSSQFLSSLLLIAPYTETGLDIHVTHGPVSKPYIDMTVDIMEQLGVQVSRDGYTYFHVPGNQMYCHGTYTVEPDCSQAGYFWAAAAVTKKRIKVNHITQGSRQGDVRFVDVLEKMGCGVEHEKDGIAVTGGDLCAVDVDMSDMPDIVPTLAVVASFARGTTNIKNVAHLKEKESDRLGSVAFELKKMGIEAKANDTGLSITGGRPHGADIHTYKDHRMAMSFAIAGLVVPDIRIMDEMCVEKSFPNFWDVFERLYA